MIKAIFYSKFDTQEGKSTLSILAVAILINTNRAQGRPPSPRWRHRPLRERALATPLSDLLRYLLLRDPTPGTLRKLDPGLHERPPHLGLSYLHQVAAI